MKQESFDPGLTTTFSGELRRTINRDGSFNVHRKGLRWRDANLYLMLIDTTWPKFLTVVGVAFIAINMLFAYIYMALGIEHLQGTEPEMSAFVNAFFFSVHTLTTVGYGNVFPRGFGANAVAALEATTGLMMFALAQDCSTAAFPDHPPEFYSAIMPSWPRIRTAPACNSASQMRGPMS